MTKQVLTTDTPIPTVPLPSADLIKYRFDQSDQNLKDFKKETKEQFEQLNSKLDNMSQAFATQKDLDDAKKEGADLHRALWDEIKAIRASFKWWATWVVTAIGAAAGVVYAISQLMKK